MTSLFKLLFSSSWVRAFWLWHNEKSTAIYHDLHIAKAQVYAQMQLSGIHPSSNQLLPLPTLLCPQGDIPLSPFSFRRAEPVMVLAHDDKCPLPVWPTRQCGRSSPCPALRSSNTCTRYPAQMSQPPAGDTAKAAARWAHLSQLTDPHPALGQFAVICFYSVSCLTTNLPILLQHFTNSHAGLLPSKEIPSEATVSTPLLFLHWHQVSTLPSRHRAADVWQTTLHNLLDQG